jgi:subtilisin family serine protease
MVVVAGAGCAALAAVTFVVVGGGEGRDAARDGADPGIDPTDLLSEDQLELIRGTVPGPGCGAAPEPAPEPASDDASLVAMDVLRVEGTCLTTVTEYVVADRVDDRRDELERDPAVVTAAVSPPEYAAQVDDRRDDQWALDALGVPEGSSELPWPDGTGVVVAVLDTGVDASHPDLADAVIARRHYPGEGDLDPDGHGTHVAGIIAARRGNGGIVGVAPAATILDVPVPLEGDNRGAGSSPTGLVWAVNNGATVANMSFGAALSEYEKPEYEGGLEFWAAAVVFALHNDVVVVAAGGNCGGIEEDIPTFPKECVDRHQREVPAALAGVVSVGAVAQDDGDLPLARFSTRNGDVDLVAPGDDILSTYPDREHKTLDGTSQAAPQVAAAAAAARSVYPTATADQVVQALLDTADVRRLAEDDRSDPGAGHGLLDIVGTLEALSTGPLPEPEDVADRTQAAFVRDGTLFAFDSATAHPVRRVDPGNPVTWVEWSADHTQLVGVAGSTLFSWAGPGSEPFETPYEPPCEACGPSVAYLDDVAGTEAGTGDLVVSLDYDSTLIQYTLTQYEAHTLQQLGTATLEFPPDSAGTKTLHGDVNGLLLVHESGGAHASERLWLVDPVSREARAPRNVAGQIQGRIAGHAAGDQIALVTGYTSCANDNQVYVLDGDDLTQLANPATPSDLTIDELFFNGDALYATMRIEPGETQPCTTETGSAGLWRLDGGTWRQVDPNPIATARPLEGRAAAVGGGPGEPAAANPPTGWLVVLEDGRGSLRPPQTGDTTRGDLGRFGQYELWSTPTRTEVEPPRSGAGDAEPAAGAVPAEMAGTWSGTVEQTGAKTSTYTAVLDLTTLSPTATGTSDYPELGCGGDLRLDTVEGDVVMVTEIVTYGSRCVSEVPIRLELQGPNELLYTFDDGRNQGSGVLTRS